MTEQTDFLTRIKMRHADLLMDFFESNATVEDMARAWASIDGKRDQFDANKDAEDYGDGHYEGYLTETEEMLKRAVKYANERTNGEQDEADRRTKALIEIALSDEAIPAAELINIAMEALRWSTFDDAFILGETTNETKP